jgi:hypothetical protein
MAADAGEYPSSVPLFTFYFFLFTFSFLLFTGSPTGTFIALRAITD